ncbi:MAG TPA: hypothetical protein VE093_13735 [Polyangiaceae bacterium]|jgi:hypothetical protein|nr:hypothetical protein [Polyangiaceae bacterium]
MLPLPVFFAPDGVAPQATTSAEAQGNKRPSGAIHVAVSAAGGSSDWSGDPVGYGGLRLGLRLFGILTPFAEGRLGYGKVDQRLLTFLSLGLEAGVLLQGRFYPRGFLAFVHQHEESMAAVAEEPFGAVLGIGPGIRHRAGVHFGAGFDFVIHRAAGFELTVGPELSGAYLTYSSGPNWYGMASASLGGSFRLF